MTFGLQHIGFSQLSSAKSDGDGLKGTSHRDQVNTGKWKLLLITFVTSTPGRLGVSERGWNLIHSFQIRYVASCAKDNGCMGHPERQLWWQVMAGPFRTIFVRNKNGQQPPSTRLIGAASTVTQGPSVKSSTLMLLSWCTIGWMMDIKKVYFWKALSQPLAQLSVEGQSPINIT